jgi:uncharacterized protein involved in exopolysaccharide biosynthesis
MSSASENLSLVIVGARVARSWKPAAAVFTVSFCLIAVITLFLPNKYQARLKILVKNERVDPVLSLDKQTQGILYLDDISEARINTEIELLTSTDILRQVVSACHLTDRIGLRRQSQAQREATALRRLQKDLVITAVRKSNVIEATYQSTDPKQATEVLRTLSEIYLGAHLKLHGAPGSSEFFHHLADSFADRLEKAEGDLAKFRQAHNIITLPEEKTLALERVTDLEKQYAESAAAARKTSQQSSRLEKIVAATPATIERERRSMPNQYAIEQLGTILIGLQNKRAEAALRYQPTDRIIQALDTQIQQTQAGLAAASQTNAEEVSSGPNPTLGAAQSEYIRIQADYAGNEAQTAQIAQQLQMHRGRLLALDAETVPYSDLVRRVKQMEELSETYNKMADEANVTEMLDKQRISNVAIAEHPYQSAVPSSPNRGLLLSLGFFWSLLLGMGTAVGADFLTERVSTPLELEQTLSVPLLATVPKEAIVPSYGGAFPALYTAMRRTDFKANRDIL